MAARGLSGVSVVWRRRTIAIAALVAVILAGYFLWFRDSSLVAVDEVKVEGATTNQEQITEALTAAADGMSTLNVDEQELAMAVSGFPTVASIRADAGPPHSLTIIVTERLPVAQVEIGGDRVAVSAEGYVLPGIEVAGSKLPTLAAARAEGGRLGGQGAAQAAALGAAPEELRERLDAAAWDPERGGVVIELEGAPELRFGDGDRTEDKWDAVASVLAAPDLGSPAYVDVSVPERPVTGA